MSGQYCSARFAEELLTCFYIFRSKVAHPTTKPIERKRATIRLRRELRQFGKTRCNRSGDSILVFASPSARSIGDVYEAGRSRKNYWKRRVLYIPEGRSRHRNPARRRRSSTGRNYFSHPGRSRRISGKDRVADLAGNDGSFAP